MALKIDQLQLVKRLHNGVLIAQCPACAAVGQDSHGNHLKVLNDGRYCCVVNPGKDGKEHRKEIFRLVGDRQRERPPLRLVYTVKVAKPFEPVTP